MSGVKSPISIVDRFSATFRKFVQGAERSTRSIDNMKNKLDQRTDFVNQLQRVDKTIERETFQYEKQAKVLDELKAKQAFLSERYGEGARATQALANQVALTEKTLQDHLNVVKHATVERNKLLAESHRYEVPENVFPPGFIEQLQRAEQMVEILGTKYGMQRREVAQLNQALEQEVRLTQGKSDKTELLRRQIADATIKELQFAEAVDKAGANLDRLRQQAEELVNPINNSCSAQERFNREIQNGSRATDKLLGRLKSVFAAYLGFRGAKRGFGATIGGSAELDQQSLMMQAAFGDTAVGDAYFSRIQEFAVRTGHSMEQLTDTTRNFMQLTKNTNKLRELTDLAHRLSLRTQNLGSAETLMQEAIRGQFTRLQRELHLTDSQIAPLKEAVQQGSLDGIMTAFDQALNTAGLTTDIIDAFENSPLQKFNNVLSQFKLRFAHTGQTALERLTPLLERIDLWLQTDNAFRFFNAIAVGIAGLTNGVVFIIDYVQANWATIQGILIAIGVLIMAHVVSSLITAGVALVTLNWPILLIIAGVSLLVYWLNKVGVTTEEITGFVGMLFGLMYARIFNVYAKLHNVTASTAEFFANAWHHPIYSTKKLFADFVDNALANLQRVAEAMDFVFRTKTSQKVQGWRDDLKGWVAETPEGYRVLERLEEMSIQDAMQKGFDIGWSLPSKFTNGFDAVTNAINDFADIEAKWNAKQLDTLGDINSNTNQMAEEDLKWLRDVAEQDVVNKFTTATLAPQIKIEFGDVKETADVDGIVKKLVDILTEQINVAAEGVHA